MQQPMNPTSSTPSLIPNVPQHISCIVGILLRGIVVPHDCRNPCGYDIEVCSAREFAWVKMVVDDDWDIP
jgi:hypothetical protein